MPQNIIFISGFGGSGKTSSGQLLFEKIKSAAFFDADHGFIAKPLPIGEKLSRIKVTNATSIIRTYVEGGFKNIICSGLIWSQEEMDRVIEQLSKFQVNFFLIWLETSKNVRFHRALKRAQDEFDSRKFLEKVESKIKDPWPLKHKKVESVLINTDGRSIADVVKEMQRILKRKH